MFHVEQNLLNDYKKYKKILKNINLLLIKKINTKEIELWFKVLSEVSTVLNKLRYKYINILII